MKKECAVEGLVKERAVEGPEQEQLVSWVATCRCSRHNGLPTQMQACRVTSRLLLAAGGSSNRNATHLWFQSNVHLIFDQNLLLAGS